MSHQSGIQVSEELSTVFKDAVSNGTVRIIRVSIEKESLVPNGTTLVEGEFKSDYEKHIEEYLETSTPAYIFVRLDKKASSGEHEWLFLCYVPDNAKVRDKMIYASTRATLTKELGNYRFTDHIYGTNKSEFTWDGYEKHLRHKAAEAPLTRREQELAEIKAAEVKAISDYQGTATRKSHVSGIVFPLTEKAKEALVELSKKKDERTNNFVTLYVEKETIDLDKSVNVTVNDLKSTIDENAPRFTFYVYDNGSNESLVFIYTCPSKSKIKERMLYSASKENTITAAENDTSLKVVKKFETSDLSDLTKSYFDEELTTSTTDSNDDTLATGSTVSDRINMLGGSEQRFKRPVAPNRRKPTSST